MQWAFGTGLSFAQDKKTGYCMLKPWARRATARPILPNPIIPSVEPRNRATPANVSHRHIPYLILITIEAPFQRQYQ